MEPAISVTGGQMHFPEFKNNLKDSEFEVVKSSVWLHMVNDMMRPVKWLKTTAKGTKVNWIPITSKEAYEEAIKELEAYIDWVNQNFDVGIKLQRKSD